MRAVISSSCGYSDGVLYSPSAWVRVSTAKPFYAQGYTSPQGHPYVGPMWYRFDVEVPADAIVPVALFVHKETSKLHPDTGKLIEAAGLKGARIGNAEVSPLHGNFFINHGATRAEDIRALIELVMKTLKETQGIDLELEIELVGEW